MVLPRAVSALYLEEEGAQRAAVKVARLDKAVPFEDGLAHQHEAVGAALCLEAYAVVRPRVERTVHERHRRRGRAVHAHVLPPQPLVHAALVRARVDPALHALLRRARRLRRTVPGAAQRLTTVHRIAAPLVDLQLLPAAGMAGGGDGGRGGVLSARWHERRAGRERLGRDSLAPLPARRPRGLGLG